MSQNKPSYGVFMVDIFASSVGIFILVSLLYIIESSKATSNEAMVERFKTLIKRDLVPVDRYSLPVSNDPLHDWGVRARHAREKQEALILLLRDKVLLYHTNQLLDTKQIVDSDIILNYYQKYNKNRRLFIEIHYHDAYHTLKAKISEALPENVHQWVHWAYNAGNINNPNPVSQNAARPNIDMTPNGRFDRPIDPDALGMPSSVGGGASANGTNSTAQGTSDGQSTSQQGQNAGQNQAQGEGDGNGEGNGNNMNGQNGDEQGSGENSGENSVSEGQDSGLGEGNQLSQEQQAVQQALAQMNTMQDFIEQLMAPMESPSQQQNEYKPPSQQTNNDTKAGSQTNDRASGAGFGNTSGGSSSSNSSSNSNTSTTNNTNNNTSTGNQNDNQGANQGGGSQGNNQANSPAPEQAKEDELAMSSPEQEQLQALNLIRKNVFLKVPLHSPINNFNIDIKVPGFTEQNIHLDAVRLKLHQSATTNSNAMGISLQHGDAIVPVTTNQIDLINPVDNRGWLEVKIIKVTGKSKPLRGWIYGQLDDQGIMLPLYENTVQAEGNNNYWYERNNKPLKAFEVINAQQSTSQEVGNSESSNYKSSDKGGKQ